jgi:Mg2+ and Co2+ transporter CorA
MRVTFQTDAMQDSAIMKKQAERATLLTILAVIYLPLTLVTGIFGMNIRQIDSATTEFWAALVSLAVISGITAAGYFGYKHWHRRHDAQDLEAQKQKDMVYKIA